MIKEFDKLYKYDNNGNTREWQIIVEGDSHHCVYGIVGGKLITTKKTKVKGKNVGKVNETTPHEQAIADAESKIRKNLGVEYVTSPELAKNRFLEVFSPMAAQPVKKARLRKTYDDMKLMLSSPKLDGIRCSARWTPANEFVHMSRNNKEFYACPHLNIPMQKLIELITQACEAEHVVLDGEYYNHSLRNDFNKITSLINKKKPTQADLDETAKIIQYHVFDFSATGHGCGDMEAYERNRILRQCIQQLSCKEIIYVEQFFVTDSGKVKDVETGEIGDIMSFDTMMRKYLDMGYEGAMFRAADSIYEEKRTFTLLKHKEFIDAEFTIRKIVEGEGNLQGKVGRFVLEDTQGILEKTKHGINRQFSAAPIGSHELWQTWYENPEMCINKLGTVRYQELTPIKDDGDGGVPRFGKMVAVRDYE